jgi:hypothetical protein
MGWLSSLNPVNVVKSVGSAVKNVATDPLNVSNWAKAAVSPISAGFGAGGVNLVNRNIDQQLGNVPQSVYQTPGEYYGTSQYTPEQLRQAAMEGKALREASGWAAQTPYIGATDASGKLLDQFTSKALTGQELHSQNPYADTINQVYANIDPYAKAVSQFQGGLGNYMVGAGGQNMAAGQSALSALNQRAFSEEPSAYAKLQMTQAEQDALTQRQNLGSQIQGQQQSALTNLGMRGGLAGGARERIATSFGRQGTLQGQNIGSQLASQKQNILGQDIAQKYALQAQMPSMYSQYEGLSRAGKAQDLSTQQAGLGAAQGLLQARQQATGQDIGLQQAGLGYLSNIREANLGRSQQELINRANMAMMREQQMNDIEAARRQALEVK